MEHAFCANGETAWMETEDRARDDLNRLERLAAIGQLTGGVAHEFNNLMTIVLGNVEFLERELKDADPRIARYLSFLRIAAGRGARLSSRLLAFSGRRPTPPEPINLNETVEELSELVRTALSVEVRLDLQQELWLVRDDPAQIELLLFGLIVHDRIDGALLFETANVERISGQPEGLSAGSYVMVAVRTDAEIEPERIRETRAFAAQRGGAANAEHVMPAGTIVRLYLPRDAGDP